MSARYSKIPITEMVYALPTDNWQIRLVPDDDHNGMPVNSPIYSKGLLIKSVGFLRWENMNGNHIFGRPITCRHILVDDLCQDALDQLDRDGLHPSVGVRTSKGNHQAWITLSTDELDPAIAAAAARILAQRYDGDPGSTDAYHLGRLPGFTNRKEIYRSNGLFPYTGLRGQVRRGVAPGAAQLLVQAEEWAVSMSSSSPSTLGACALTRSDSEIDPSRSSMTKEDSQEIYEAELAYQADRKGWTLPIVKGLRSDADYAVVFGLHARYVYDPDDLAALLLYESDKAAERGMDYVFRTVQAALSL
jgi:hypothetical protein